MMRTFTNIKLTFVTVLAIAVALLVLTTGKAEAACPAVDSSRGVVTSTVSVPASGNYRVWSRMQASSATNDSFVLEIDDSVCGVVVGDASVPTDSWKWVDYKSGSTSNKVTVNLSAGQHTVKMIGREDGVKVDKLLFLSDTGCVPTNFGENCEVTPDTTPPENVEITSPANNAILSGSNVLIQAGASDDTGVTKVEFYINDTLLGTDTQSPFNFGLDSTQYTNGSYTLSARAFDAEDNNTRSNDIAITINNPVPDTTPPQLTITAPFDGSTVTGTVNVTSSVSDDVAISGVDIYVDNTKLTTLSSGTTYVYNLDSSDYTNGNHAIKVVAIDTSNNQTEKSIVVNVDNSVPPTQSQAADFNQNGTVDLGDLAVLIRFYGQTVSTGTNGDCSGDGRVDLVDLAMLVRVYGT